MALDKITYTNKETLNEQPSIADKNKVKAADMNEIKSVVNLNADKVGDLENLNTSDKTSIVGAINSIKISTLWSGAIYEGYATLNESLENYDFLLVGIQAANTYTKHSELIPTSDISYQTSSTSSYNTYDITAFQSISVYSDLQIYFENSTKLVIRSESHSGWDKPYLKYVIGIKL